MLLHSSLSKFLRTTHSVVFSAQTSGRCKFQFIQNLLLLLLSCFHMYCGINRMNFILAAQTMDSSNPCCHWYHIYINLYHPTRSHPDLCVFAWKKFKCPS